MSKHLVHQNIAISMLQASPYQARQVFDLQELEELSETIKLHGLIQPIVVRPKNAGYEIVAGERRWRAAKLAGLAELPCIVKAYTDEQAAAVGTIENTGRVQLTAVEEAMAYQRLLDEFHYTHEEVAAIVGKSRTKVSNILRLLKLHHRVQTAIMQGVLTEGHGKVLAGLAVEQHVHYAELAIEKGWSVRQLEFYLKKEQSKPTRAIVADNDPDVAVLASRLSEQLGAPVRLLHDDYDGGGKLVIQYYDVDTLAGLLEKMQLDYQEH